MVITWSDLLRWSFGKKKQTPTFGEERPILPYPPERMVGVWTVRGGWSMSCRTEHTNIDQWDTSLDVGCARGTGNLPQKKRIGQDIARSNFVTSDLYPQNKCNKPSTTTTTWSPAAVYFFTIILLWRLSLKNLHILSASQCGSKLRRWYLLASSHSTTGWRHTKFNLD